METLADRATHSLTRHPSPALPLDELTDQVRGGGTVVGAGVLLRALEARPDLFRVLDPWRGPWRSAATRATTAHAPGSAPAGPTTGSPVVALAAATRWVVPLGRATYDRDLRGRIKASVAHLGRTLDERSVTDLARWLGMVREMSHEGERPRQSARTPYTPARVNQPERQSPSASEATSSKPE